MLNKIKSVLREVLMLNETKPKYQLSENEKKEFNYYLKHTNLIDDIKWIQDDLYDIDSAHELMTRSRTAWLEAKIDSARYDFRTDTVYFDSGELITGEYERHIKNVTIVGNTVLNTVVLRKYFK